MRRKDREILEVSTMHQIMGECTCCRIGFCDEGEVYIVPMNFGFSVKEGETTLYFHSANEGRKIDLIKKSKGVGFEMDTNYALRASDVACECSAQFESIIGNGEISIVNEREEKIHGLQRIMYQNTKKEDWTFQPQMVDRVLVFKIVVKTMTCKVHE